jgi:DNA-binding LytR/AlgR family response regulator
MQGAGAEATLRARLPAHLDAEIVALKAEDHYVRVYTQKGDTLVHYRFRDAVQDLRGIDGLQVHRSYWVRRSAITGRATRAHSQVLLVGSDLSIPISRSYQRMLDAGGPDRRVQ